MRRLLAEILIDPERHRAHPSEIVAEAGKKLFERDLSAGQQPVRMRALRRPCPVRCRVGKNISLQHRHLLEPAGENPGSRQPGQAGADDDGPSGNELRIRRRMPLLDNVVTHRNLLASTSEQAGPAGLQMRVRTTERDFSRNAGAPVPRGRAWG